MYLLIQISVNLRFLRMCMWKVEVWIPKIAESRNKEIKSCGKDKFGGAVNPAPQGISSFRGNNFQFAYASYMYSYSYRNVTTYLICRWRPRIMIQPILWQPLSSDIWLSNHHTLYQNCCPRCSSEHYSASLLVTPTMPRVALKYHRY